MGLLGLFAGYRSIWVEGWGVWLRCLRLGPRAGDGWVEAEVPKMIKKELMLLYKYGQRRKPKTKQNGTLIYVCL